MPREVMLRCFGGTSSIMIANKKKMTKYPPTQNERQRELSTDTLPFHHNMLFLFQSYLSSLDKVLLILFRK